MAKSKTYELAIKIAGKADSSLKAACKQADESLSSLGESAKKAGEIAKKAFVAAGTAAATIAAASVTAYTQHEKAANSLAASTGAVGQEMENLQAAMETVYLDNFVICPDSEMDAGMTADLVRGLTAFDLSMLLPRKDDVLVPFGSRRPSSCQPCKPALPTAYAVALNLCSRLKGRMSLSQNVSNFSCGGIRILENLKTSFRCARRLLLTYSFD